MKSSRFLLTCLLIWELVESLPGAERSIISETSTWETLSPFTETLTEAVLHITHPHHILVTPVTLLKTPQSITTTPPTPPSPLISRPTCPSSPHVPNLHYTSSTHPLPLTHHPSSLPTPHGDPGMGTLHPIAVDKKQEMGKILHSLICPRHELLKHTSFLHPTHHNTRPPLYFMA